MSNDANMNNIRQILKLARNNGFLSLKSYDSASGQNADFLIQPLGDDGYPKLVRKSIEEAQKLERPSEFDEELWNKAMKSQIESWEKTLGEGHGRKDNFEKIEKSFFNHKDNEDAVYIRNFVIVNKTVNVKGTFKKVNSKPLTLAKKHIRNNVSLKKFQASMKLEMGKFEYIRYKNITIQGR